MDVLNPAPRRGTAAEVFGVALGLGLTSFGGPIAHIGYFERAYVRRRQWLDAEAFAALVALCQMVPGPASSQLGFLIGWRRAGWTGALAAWLGFTLPSALMMFGFALWAPRWSGPMALAGLHGLRLVAVAVVAQAVVGMGRAMCPDRIRLGIAVAAAVVLLVVARPEMPVVVLALAALGGMRLCRVAAGPGDGDGDGDGAGAGAGMRPHTGAIAVVVFAGLLALTVAAPWPVGSWPALAAVFYRSGALVFGGGHVVLPLLREALVPAGWLTDGTFLAGYGAAQAVPGPLFSFAADLGAAMAPPGAGLATAALWSLTALVAVFLPGLLAAVAALSLWHRVGHRARARAAIAGVNAAVVGVLAAALYDPIWTTAVFNRRDAAIAGAALCLLDRWRVPPVVVVGLCVAAAVAAG